MEGGGALGRHNVMIPSRVLSEPADLGFLSGRDCDGRTASVCISAGCAVMTEFQIRHSRGHLLPCGLCCALTPTRVVPHFVPLFPRRTFGCTSNTIRTRFFRSLDSLLATHAALASDCHAVHSWPPPTIDDVPSLAARRQRASYTAKPPCPVLF